MKIRTCLLGVGAILAASCSGQKFSMVSTMENNPWVENSVYDETLPGTAETLTVDLTAEGQTIKGFGVCFSELSHRALSKLSSEDYDKVMTELFAPNVGASFTICRMPIGSSDFGLKYYSFDDYPGDFAMEHFSIDNDKQTIIPLIKDAMAKNPSLKVWGSPWCPPQWMKVNQHYASRPMTNRMMGMGQRRPGAGAPDRGLLRELQVLSVLPRRAAWPTSPPPPQLNLLSVQLPHANASSLTISSVTTASQWKV